jgi:DNA-binding beta-propeller fold protein YncE
MRWRWGRAAAFAGALLACSPALAATPDEAAAEVRARIEASPVLPFVATDFAARQPTAGWTSGMVSWVAFDGQGHLYELQRGDKADPVLVLDRDGKVLRSWGKGGYTIPHAVRIDPKGAVWTVDAGASRVIEYSPRGEKLMTIEVGEAPYRANGFSGTSDIAFGKNGHLFIADGYGNARVLEYSADGKRLRQWGEPGTGPGQFHLPHALQIGADGTIYVADRENGRIQKFDMDGKYLGEIGPLGRTYSLKLAGGALWAATAPLNLPTGSPGWLVKIDPKTGKILGHLEAAGEHGMDVSPAGEPVTTAGDHVIWFRKR